MDRKLTCLTLLLVVNLLGIAAGESPQVVVAFGDSTTAPRGELVVYATLLEKTLAAQGRPARVINAGVPGNSTADAAQRFEKEVLAQNPHLVILQFGINDAAVNVWADPPATEPRVSLEQYEKNLNRFLERLKERDVAVILMTPNPCRWAEETRKLYGKPPYKPEDPDGFNVLLRDYAEIARKVARQQQVPLVDVYAAFQAYGRQPGQTMDDLLLDGMHPNAQGQQLVAQLLLATKGLGASAGK